MIPVSRTVSGDCARLLRIVANVMARRIAMLL